LKCFSGGCHSQGHAKQHAFALNHPIACRIKRIETAASKAAAEEAKQVDTLSIQAVNKEYDYSTACICYLCDPDGIVVSDDLPLVCH
jgi:hypothetical protein